MEIWEVLTQLYVALCMLSVLTTRYCIPYEYLAVQHHICSTRIPFEPPTQSVAHTILNP